MVKMLNTKTLVQTKNFIHTSSIKKIFEKKDLL